MAEFAPTAVIGKVVDSLFAVKKQIGYMWNYTQIVENLRKEVEELKDMKGRVERQIDFAVSDGMNLKVGVQSWLEKATVEVSKAEEFLQEEANAKKTCFKIGMCGNWATRHRYGKMATKMTPSLLEHQRDGTDFQTGVTIYTRALDVYENKNLDDIHTHNSALKDIIKSLEDESIQIIGIYGLGGVGKTTLAMEVAARVKNLFADVAFTTVSQTVNAEKIQKDLVNATKRIKKGDKILIILDDVWEELNLEELCIPCGYNYINCKILLTSRSEKVCQKMNAQSKICVNSLPTEEAWILFKRVVGERLETDSNLKPVALRVVEECGGLPLLIQSVGNALKDESIRSWNWALTQLQKHAPSEIDPDIRKAFSHVKLSYDYLKNEEAKSCFLLCSMFPADSYIKLEDLVHYMVGLEEFDDLDSIEDARDRVQNAVNILTSSCLLLNSERKGCTKMHDVVRDVALLIASQGNTKLLVRSGIGLTEWLPRNTNLTSYKGISLMYNNINKLPDYELLLPHIHAFLVQNNEQLSYVPDEFIQGITQVKLLDMSSNSISYLPQSLKLLTKLRMLNLSYNKTLYDISILGELKDLEILNLKSTGIKKIPEEIGQLIRLRVLNVESCENLSYVTPGVISKLFRLEELHIRFLEQKGVDGCLLEINTLKRLKILSLSVPRCDLVPEESNFETLKEFRIQLVGSGSWDQVKSHIKRQLRIIGCSFPFTKPIMKLIQVSDAIEMSFIKDLVNLVPDLCQEGLDQLKSIILQDCNNVTSLVNACHPDAMQTSVTSYGLGRRKTEEMLFSQLEEIVLECLSNLKVILWNCPRQHISFQKLKRIRVIGCPSLSMLFPISVAQSLVSLKYIDISECNSLEVVISARDETTDSGEIEKIGRSGSEQTDLGMHNAEILFPCLISITLHDLPKLHSFYSGYSTIKYPSLALIRAEDCSSMMRWGYGVHDIPNIDFHHHGKESNINDVIALHHKKGESILFQSKIRMDSFSSGEEDGITEE